MRKTLVVTLLLLLAAAVPAVACTQICRYSGGGDSCDQAGYVTGMSCYMQGDSCIDVQEYGCWAPKPGEENIAVMIGLPQLSQDQEICLAQ